MLAIKDRVTMLTEQVHTLCSTLSRPLPTLMAVTKYASYEQSQAVLDAGLSLLGENKVQDGITKRHHLSPCHMHLIGHLQSNKVLKAVQGFDCIQSVDSLKLATKIHQTCLALNKVMPVYLELNIGEESSKHGFLIAQLWHHLDTLWTLSGLDIQGLMVIPPASNDPEDSREFFKKAKKIQNTIYQQHPHFVGLSMGMSHDFKVAIEEGSTCVRIGGFLFH